MSGRAPRRSALGAGLLWLALLVAALAGSCRVQAPVARFPHRAHLAGIDCGKPGKPACLSCNTCHTPSRRERELKLPPAEMCESCHKQDRARVEPVLAFVPERPHGQISMDHERHLAMPEIRGQCVPCHGGVVEPAKSNLPPMSQCFGCHEHQTQWQRNECAPCHEPRDLARTLPQTFLRHDAAFAKNHGPMAASQGELCATCHSQSSCQGCHDTSQAMGIEIRRPDRLDSQQVHRGDFMVRHALEAASQPSRCLNCHAPQTCDSCHAQRGVSGNVRGALNPHPLGWVGSNTASSSFHGPAARRDIASCAACHEQGPATNCIRCHKVGAFGGSPHPPGFRSTQSLNSQMCRYCHG